MSYLGCRVLELVRRVRRRWRRPALVVALTLAGCGHVTGPYVWVDAYRDPTAGAAKGAYVIARGDVLAVRVWNQDSMSGRARVRNDGMISLPFVNDVEAAGLEPAGLAKRIQAKLKEFIVNPVVSVSVEEQVAMEVSVVGEVAKPGVFHLDNDAGVLKALARAGGLTQVASRDRIFVLREEGVGDSRSQVRIRFDYEALARGDGPAGRFRLRSGDTVVVE